MPFRAVCDTGISAVRGLRNTRLELKRRSSPGQPTPNTQPFPHQQQLSSNSFLYPPHSLERKQIKHNNTSTLTTALNRSHLTIDAYPKALTSTYQPTNQPTLQCVPPSSLPCPSPPLLSLKAPRVHHKPWPHPPHT